MYKKTQLNPFFIFKQTSDRPDSRFFLELRKHRPTGFCVCEETNLAWCRLPSRRMELEHIMPTFPNFEPECASSPVTPCASLMKGLLTLHLSDFVFLDCPCDGGERGQNSGGGGIFLLGCLARKETPPPRTLHFLYALGHMVVLKRRAFSHEPRKQIKKQSWRIL